MWPRGWKKGCEWNERKVLQIYTANGQFLSVNMSTLTSTKSFWVSIWIPKPRGCILTENTSFGRFSTGPCCQDHPAVVSGILDPGGLDVTFPRLEPALYLERFARKKIQITPHANLDALCPFITRKWDRLAVEYIWRICRSFCCR
jgi:hypothetical protein